MFGKKDKKDRDYIQEYEDTKRLHDTLFAGAVGIVVVLLFHLVWILIKIVGFFV